MVTDYESENEESQLLATIPSVRFIFSPSNKGSPTDHTLILSFPCQILLINDSYPQTADDHFSLSYSVLY